jgi:hypothetical protein
MKRKSILITLILLLLSASSAAAQPLTHSPGQQVAAPAIAATPTYAQGGCFVAGLNGGNETLALRQASTQQVVTPATGLGAFVLAPSDPITTTRKLTYSIAFTNTLGPETTANIHKGAPGVAGPPIIALPIGNPKEGTLSLNAQNVADLLAGLLYVNIGTAPNATGEIRGQILPGGGCFSARLSGASEAPEPNVSPAIGNSVFLLLPPDPITTTRKLVYDIEFAGLSAQESRSDIRKGAPGTTGSVVFPLPLGASKQGRLNLDPSTVSDLLAGLLYVDVRSQLVTAGEIRGQILPFGGGCYSVTLSGSTETPPNASTATGQGTFFLTPSTLSTTLKLAFAINYSATLNPTMAHIHKAAQGIAVPNNIVFPLSTSNPISGTLTLNQEQAADLMSGLYYVNIHSATFTQGEIRGQIVQSTCLTAYIPFSAK